MERATLEAQYEEVLTVQPGPKMYQLLNELSRQAARFLNALTAGDKYFHEEFPCTIRDSALGAPRFTGSNASVCFVRLEKMAKNLLICAWRVEEYHVIAKYTPFFESLRSTLSNVDDLFWLMGYRPNGAHTLQLQVMVEAVVLKRIAFDCFLASVECQLVQSAYNQVCKQRACSWKEVVDRRQRHFGTGERWKVQKPGEARRLFSGDNNGTGNSDGGATTTVVSRLEELWQSVMPRGKKSSWSSSSSCSTQIDHRQQQQPRVARAPSSTVVETAKRLSAFNYKCFTNDGKGFRPSLDKRQSGEQCQRGQVEARCQQCPRCRMITSDESALCNFCDYYFKQ